VRKPGGAGGAQRSLQNTLTRPPFSEAIEANDTGEEAGTIGTLTLTRVPLPTHYPLLDRGSTSSTNGGSNASSYRNSNAREALAGVRF